MQFFDPNDAAQRDSLLSDHPVVRNRYIALTPTIEYSYRLVRERIWLSSPSVYFFSTPRMGKSQCAKAIRHLASQEFANKYIVLAACDLTHEESVVFTIANAIGLFRKAREPIDKLRERIITHILCELSSIDGSHFLLLLDEMQTLGEKEYQHLQVIQNRLKLLDVSMTTIGFAQTEINSVRTSFIASDQTALVARFLSERIEFRGCSSKEWLEEVLRSFDEILFYPVDSNCSYTQFFLPKAFSVGFRISFYSSMIYDCAVEAVSGSSKRIIPVEHMFHSVQLVLINSRLSDDEGFVLNINLVKDAMLKSGMSEFAKLMGNGQ
ncbi:hypothetical protein [Pseudomonas sp.]|uniref:hypothetical protein n=1 Tax=Pseudomonas sp. TaxID=306 RepID=UPI003F3048E7